MISLEDLFARLVRVAQKEKYLSEEIAVNDIVLSLTSLLVGVPLLIEGAEFRKIKKIFRTQLTMLWKGLQGMKGYH